MSDPDDIATIVASLRKQHQALAIQSVEGTASAADCQNLIEALVAAGARVPSGPDRDGLRNLLFFWASRQASQGEPQPDRLSVKVPKLAPFEAGPDSKPAAAESQAPAEVASRAEAAGRTSADRAAPPQSSALARRCATILDAATQISGTVGDLLKTLRPIEEPQPRAAATPGAMPEAVTDQEARAIVRIGALARQWRNTSEANKRGYLLTSANALEEAALYVDVDPDIRDLVAASVVEARAKRATAFVGLLICVLLVVIAIAIYWRLQLYKQENVTLNQTDLARIRGRQEISAEARRAVDALAGGQIEPLKQFLQQIGDASPSELAKLQVSGSVATSADEIVETKAPRRERPQAQVSLASPKEACKGYLWFGNLQNSRLSDGRDPMSLRNGETVMLTDTDLRLRSDWPAEGTYAMSPQVGLVPGGSTVRLDGDPRLFPRSLPQVWAPVRVPQAFCTKVSFQYVGTPKKRDAVLAALRDLAVQVLPAEQIATVSDLAEVRYFWPADKAIAKRVADALGKFSPAVKLKLVGMTDYPSKPLAGTVEVRLDLK